MSNTTSNSGSQILHKYSEFPSETLPGDICLTGQTERRMRATWLKSFKGRTKSSLLSSLS